MPGSSSFSLVEWQQIRKGKPHGSKMTNESCKFSSLTLLYHDYIINIHFHASNLGLFGLVKEICSLSVVDPHSTDY